MLSEVISYLGITDWWYCNIISVASIHLYLLIIKPMAEEAYVDEQNEQVDVSDVTEDEYSYEEETSEVEDVSVIKSSYEEQLAAKQKEIERLAKFEARYKSNKKAEATKPKADVSSGDSLWDIVASKIQEYQEQSEFKKTYGDEIFNDVIEIKKQHPTLTLEQAMKFSPIANDPARTANSEEYSSPWRAKIDTTSSKYITNEAWSKLPQREWNIIDDKVKSGEIIVRD